MPGPPRRRRRSVISTPSISPRTSRASRTSSRRSKSLTSTTATSGSRTSRFPAASMRGVAASAATGRAYFTFYNTPKDTYQTGGLVCLDLVTNKVLWIRHYTKDQVPSPDRFDITPYGKTIYMPVGENGPDNFWRIIDASTGNPLGKINFVTAPHNTIVSTDGKKVFMEGQEKGPQPAEWNHRIGVVDVATNKLVKTIGPFRDVVRPFTVNGKGTLVFATVNNWVGFQVGDVGTGKI